MYYLVSLKKMLNYYPLIIMKQENFNKIMSEYPTSES